MEVRRIFSLGFKVFCGLFAISTFLFIKNLDEISERAPAKYRGVLERMSDLLFGKTQIVEIYGNEIISKPEILLAIYRNDVGSDDLIKINQLHKIKKTLMEHPLIESVSVKRFLPNKMVVYVREKQVIMQFYSKPKGRFFAISKEGQILEFYSKNLKVPLFRGDYANLKPEFAKALLKFYAQIAASPVIMPVVTDIEPFLGYRFNIVLSGKTLVSLPENDPPLRLKHLETLIVENNILNKPIKHLDLRAPGKIFIERFGKSEPQKYEPLGSITTLYFN